MPSDSDAAARPSRLWLFIMVLLFAAIIGAPLIYDVRHVGAPPRTMTLEALAERGKSLGWEVVYPLQEADGAGALFIDRKRNPDARTIGGASQRGALYIVETDSPKVAEEKAKHPTLPCEAWGHWYFAGELAMMDELVK